MGSDVLAISASNNGVSLAATNTNLASIGNPGVRFIRKSNIFIQGTGHNELMLRPVCGRVKAINLASKFRVEAAAERYHTLHPGWLYSAVAAGLSLWWTPISRTPTAPPITASNFGSVVAVTYIHTIKNSYDFEYEFFVCECKLSSSDLSLVTTRHFGGWYTLHIFSHFYIRNNAFCNVFSCLTWKMCVTGRARAKVLNPYEHTIKIISVLL